MAYTKCWLAYPAIPGASCKGLTVCVDGTDPVLTSARAELARGLAGLYGAEVSDAQDADIRLCVDETLHPEGYRVTAEKGRCTVAGGSAVGVLYGVFALLRAAQMAGCPWQDLTVSEEKAPANHLRMLNHWDNLDGSIERGYSGESFFYKDDVVLVVDDILSNGQAVLSLLELVSKAGGEVAGVAVAIEKAMRDGGRVLRRMGLRVEALATVERVEGERIILR